MYQNARQVEVRQIVGLFPACSIYGPCSSVTKHQQPDPSVKNYNNHHSAAGEFLFGNGGRGAAMNKQKYEY